MTQMEKNVPKILIVDDVEANRFLLRDMIQDMGYQPILAENGVQALRAVSIMWPQLILLDVSMPQMDGFEVCERLKKDPRTRNIPVVFISAYQDEKEVVRGFELGGEDYITKPFLPEVVKARVGLHLRLYEAGKELIETNRRLQAAMNQQIQRVEAEKRNLMLALTRVASENAAYDKNHVERVSHNCRLLTEAMQLSPHFSQKISDAYVDMIELSAPLSDMGNVAIATSILQKEEGLLPEELEKIHEHTVIGARIFQDVQQYDDRNEFLQMAYEVAKGHHEHWDGSGYPEGLQGDEIPLSAQILGVASDYCALTEDRVYRKAYSKEESIEIMQADAGKKYNPYIVEILAMIARRLR